MKRRAMVALLAAGALTLAACGGDDDDDTAETEAPQAPATEAPSTEAPSTEAPGTEEPSTEAPSTEAPSTDAPATPGEDWPDELVLTLTPSQEAGTLVQTAQPLADALSAALGIPVSASVPTDYASVIVALQSGQAHIAGGLGPSQMVQAADTAGADLVLQSVRFGYGQYVTQWFTNNPDEFCTTEVVDVVDEDDGTIFKFCNGVDAATDPAEGPIGADVLGNVAGKTVAFVDQGSTSGYLVPSLGLISAGVDPLSDITATFAGGHDLAVQAVYDGDADVGVSFNDARGQLVQTVPDVGEKVVVFAWSDPIPNDGFAVAGDLPDDLKQAIVDALVAFTETEEGAVTMDELYEIDGLVPVPEGSYDIIRRLETELADLMG